MSQFRDNDHRSVSYWDGDILRDSESHKQIGYREGNKVYNTEHKLVNYTDGNMIRNADHQVIGYRHGNKISDADYNTVGYLDRSSDWLADPYAKLKSMTDDLASAMLPNVNGLAGNQDFIEAWVPAIRDARLKKEREAREKAQQEEYEQNPIGFVIKKIDSYQRTIDCSTGIHVKSEMQECVRLSQELKEKGYKEAEILLDKCEQLKQERTAILTDRLEEIIQRKADNQKKYEVTHYRQFEYFGESWGFTFDDYVDELGEDHPLMQQCLKRAQGLLAASRWGENGRCIKCGGKLSIIGNKCKSCGKVNNKYLKKGSFAVPWGCSDERHSYGWTYVSRIK